ncbi:hypothetical protein TEA_006280 [Camellia sinensis var. sinensis]|uniref:Uncharacterized protein n=1 Tax=Camellia sinensis var. sinensis TaxID=542762 RepID=A0A4S4E3D5_CAMSN|nr:hypothetical protein TEA_006280 [Camellia sinensis var. sinensis]
MGSALETLCGQAVGAGQFNMLGIYLQRSWIITIITASFLISFYVFLSPLLKQFHPGKDISDLAGKYCIWVIPQLFAYALNFPVQKFLQSQSKVWVITVFSIISLGIHVLLNWVLITKLGNGLLSAAIAGIISWWILVLAQIVYVVSGYFPDAWTGFSLLAFRSLTAFLKLSLASAVMLCLELWYYTAVILMVGGLQNPTIVIDAISFCVRVSNELGAGRPKVAKFSTVVTILTSTTFGVLFTAVILVTKSKPSCFREDIQVRLTLCYFQGVAVGADWQFLVAFINTGCYYVVGLPMGALLGYVFKPSAKGIWAGMFVGGLLQTVILLLSIIRTNWNEEVKVKTS